MGYVNAALIATVSGKPDIDYTSNTWLEVERWLREQIEHARDALENSNKTPEEYSKYRGQIALCRRMLDFSKPSQQ